MLNIFPNFIFYHIEKCAGSSFRMILYNYFRNIYRKKQIFVPENGNDIIYNFMPYHINFIKNDNHFDFHNLKVILSHIRYNNFPEINKRCKFKFTIVRDPCDRLISHYYFFDYKKYNYTKIDDLSLEDFNLYCNKYSKYIASCLGCVDKYNNILNNDKIDKRLSEFNFIIVLKNIDNEIKYFNNLLNKHFKINHKLLLLKNNVNKNKKTVKKSIINKIKIICKDDYIIYNKIKNMNCKKLINN